MKKYLLLALCLVFVATGVFATDFGAGLLFNNGKSPRHDNKISDFGLYGFVGWKYIDIDLWIAFENEKGPYRWGSYDPYESNGFSFQAGFNFKLPITVSYVLRFYPTIGVNVGGASTFDLNLHSGLGIDFLVYKNMYVHGIGQYNCNLFPALWYTAPFHGFLLKLGVGWMLERKKR